MQSTLIVMLKYCYFNKLFFFKLDHFGVGNNLWCFITMDSFFLWT